MISHPSPLVIMIAATSSVLVVTNIRLRVSCLCLFKRGRRGDDRMVVEFTTTYAISAYHH
jgi:hypothetical protein